MIYYSLYMNECLQNIIGLVSNEFELCTDVLSLPIDQAQKIIEKWTERYHLDETAQQRYRRRLSGEPVFSLICILASAKLFYSDEEIISRYDNDLEILSSSLQLRLFCRCSDLFLRDEDKVLSISDKANYPEINKRISQYIESAETFKHISSWDITVNSYKLVRITKPRKSIKELDKKNWKPTKHSTDWTFKLTDEAYKKQEEQGKRTVLRFQSLLEKKAELPEKKAYFEKHLKSLEGYVGYRGVRQQVGKLYHQEKRLFMSKYGESWQDHGVRKLNLAYVKKKKLMVSRNADQEEIISKIEIRLESTRIKAVNYLRVKLNP